MEQYPVDPFKIKGISQGPTDLPILERPTAGIKDKGAHGFGTAMGPGVQPHAAITHRRKVIGGCPTSRVDFVPDVGGSGLEGFQSDLVIPIIIVTKLVKIGGPSADRQISSPVIRDAAIADRAARIHRHDLIGARPQRRLQSGSIKHPCSPPSLR